MGHESNDYLLNSPYFPSPMTSTLSPYRSCDSRTQWPETDAGATQKVRPGSILPSSHSGITLNTGNHRHYLEKPDMRPLTRFRCVNANMIMAGMATITLKAIVGPQSVRWNPIK
jgi:hypothetical protein